jgi:hypothetical protein
MRVLGLRSLAVLAIGFFLLSMLSCARDQELVSIAIKPTTETFGDSNTPVSADAGSSVNLQALGNYIHPPVQKDITNQVVWSSNTPQMVTVDQAGVLTATGQSCGNALVSASVQTNSSSGGRSSSGAVVTGYMTANVVCFGAGTGGTDLPLTVVFGGGTGTITSVPAGLGCAATCSNSFPSGTAVMLTGTATGGLTTVTWLGCDSISGNVCKVNLVSNSRTVTVTFS